MALIDAFVTVSRDLQLRAEALRQQEQRQEELEDDDDNHIDDSDNDDEISSSSKEEEQAFHRIFDLQRQAYEHLLAAESPAKQEPAAAE